VIRAVSTVTWQGSRSEPKIGSWQSRQVVIVDIDPFARDRPGNSSLRVLPARRLEPRRVQGSRLARQMTSRRVKTQRRRYVRDRG
jgi:hypothetical protein